MTETEKLREWFQGNEDAARLFLELFEVSQIADDLVDSDQGHNLADRRRLACRLLHLVLISIPGNTFFNAYRGWLCPLLSDAILAWDWSTAAELSRSETTRAWAFVERDRLERAIVQAAFLIGGLEHARRVQEEVFQYFRFDHPDGQTFVDYCAEVSK